MNELTSDYKIRYNLSRERGKQKPHSSDNRPYLFYEATESHPHQIQFDWFGIKLTTRNVEPKMKNV